MTISQQNLDFEYNLSRKALGLKSLLVSKVDEESGSKRTLKLIICPLCNSQLKNVCLYTQGDYFESAAQE